MRRTVLSLLVLIGIPVSRARAIERSSMPFGCRSNAIDRLAVGMAANTVRHVPTERMTLPTGGAITGASSVTDASVP